MDEQEKLGRVIKGLKNCIDVQSGWKDAVYVCPTCPYTCNGTPCETLTSLMEDALDLLKAQEHADFIPIDWLMNYAQLPTEFAISEWRKPEKEAKIKQAKSLDKPMMLDDALELLKAQEAVEPDIEGNVEYDGHGSWWYVCGACRQPIDKGDKFCRWCGKAVKWE